MTEQEKFECFAIPAHVWSEPEGTTAAQPAGWSRRNWVFRDAANLGAEAMPSPALEEASPAPNLQLVK